MSHCLKFFTLLLCLCIFVNFGNSGKILGVFPTISKSHSILGTALMKSLAKRGHDVTMITYFPENKNISNYREIPIESDIKSVFYADMSNNTFDLGKNFGIQMILSFLNKTTTATDMILSENNVQRLLKSKEHFDVVIAVAFLGESQYAIANHFNAPLIVFSLIGASSIVNDLVGNPSPYAYVPDVMLSTTEKMTFLQRVINTLAYTIGDLFRHFIHYPSQEKIRQKYFPNLPSLYEIMYNTSLVLVNSHVSIESPKPAVPNMIEIGGFHVLDPKPLPSDLQTFLDEAKDGVIYFSLGSNVKSKDMPTEMRDAIVEVLSKLKQKILWKWEDDVLPGKPENIKTSKWFPQSDILAHPNVKLFITHGGWGGTTEAVVRGVPFIGIPVFADQERNLAIAQQSGFGISLSLNNITVQSFSWAINEALNNPKYRDNMREKSKLFKDREMKPMDRAIYWIEYVMRHKGAKHLRSPALDLNRAQLLLLDVIAFLLAVLITVLLILYFIIKMSYRLVVAIFRRIVAKEVNKNDLKHKKQQ